MAATLTSTTFRTTFGNKKVLVAKFTIGTYASGGVALTASTCGLTKIQYVSPGVTSGRYPTRYDYDNSKVLLYDFDYSTGTDGPMQETAETSSVASDTVTLLVIGY